MQSKRDIREGEGGHRRGGIQVMAVPFNDHNKPEPWPIVTIPGSTPPTQHMQNPKFMVAEAEREVLSRYGAGVCDIGRGDA